MVLDLKIQPVWDYNSSRCLSALFRLVERKKVIGTIVTSVFQRARSRSRDRKKKKERESSLCRDVEADPGPMRKPDSEESAQVKK